MVALKIAALAALAAGMLTLGHYGLTWANELIALAICGSYFYRQRHAEQ